MTMKKNKINTIEELMAAQRVTTEDNIHWWNASINLNLSEPFIEKFADKVVWPCISQYQKLSEAFIEKFADRVEWVWISQYQKLSAAFRKKHADRLTINKDNWLYKSTAFKKKAVMDTGLYECYDKYFIAYKGIRSENYSKFNFQYQYFPGNMYTCHADYTNNEDSFGLSAWTEAAALNYCDEKLIKVKIYYKDVARVVHNGGKIRCSKLTVLDEIK